MEFSDYSVTLAKYCRQYANILQGKGFRAFTSILKSAAVTPFSQLEADTGNFRAIAKIFPNRCNIAPFFNAQNHHSVWDWGQSDWCNTHCLIKILNYLELFEHHYRKQTFCFIAAALDIFNSQFSGMRLSEGGEG